MSVKKITMFAGMLVLIFSLTACNPSSYAESDTKIIGVHQLGEYMGKENVVFVDMQSPQEYEAGHIPGAVNITKDDIVINVPVNNMLTSKKKIEKLLGEKGISNDTTMLVYDSNKMNAARFFWTMLVYGNENVKVIDGGIAAIKAAGIELSAQEPAITPATYTAQDKNTQWIATMDDVRAQVDEPHQNVALLDVRSDEEYMEAGKVPSSIMWNYLDTFYADSTFKSTQTTRINYIEKGLRPEKEIIIYCQTSMRAAPVFLKLYDAGYRNIKIYDGAYLEWSSNSSNPIDMPSGSVTPSKKDAS